MRISDTRLFMHVVITLALTKKKVDLLTYLLISNT